MSDGYENMAIRERNAFDRGVDIIMDAGGIDEFTAANVAEYYLSRRLATLDRIGGQFNFKHGELLDHDVIMRAIDLAPVIHTDRV